jgi:hypothetical protein
MNSNQRSIQHVLAAKQVTSLVHFTPMQNLDSIVNNDLLSRDQCKRVGVQPTTTDNFRYDGLLDYISVSISFPNDRMFYLKQQRLNYSWAILLLSPAVITSQQSLFFSTNAASAKKTNQLDGLDSAAAFLTLFGSADTATPSHGLGRSFPADPQAEIMVKQTIAKKYIQSIVFRSTADHQNWANAGGNPSGLQVSINPDYFGRRIWLAPNNNH